jgi:phosphatidylserine decarboxylase
MDKHCYIERHTKTIVEEQLFADKFINFLYSSIRENSNFMFNLATGKTTTRLLKYFNYNKKLTFSELTQYVKKMGIKIDEIYDDYTKYKTLGDLFQRKIRYWDVRPMDESDDVIVSPADSKMMPGSLREGSMIYAKGKFFTLEELLAKSAWIDTFIDGDFAIFRLTPDEYHYNHLPVSGIVKDFYAIDGKYHSCNPFSTISLVTPLSKNRRVVTIIDTNVEGGSNIGMIAFIEVVAMMIGEICQVYSPYRYESPTDIKIGQFLVKGQPKSLYRPGSSTDIIIFEKDRVIFDKDIMELSRSSNISSRYTLGFQMPFVEVKVQVREKIGRRR